MQDTVDKYYDMFVADIAAGRGTSAAAVKDGYGQGRMVTARDALAAGMVDRIATFDDVVAAAASAPSTTTSTTARQERARYEYSRFPATG